MKPGDHPDFFRLAPPPGTSRESTIRLDEDGRFFHDGVRIDHRALEEALHSWIARHPDDGRYILTNGYDWTYFQVDDVPYMVRSVRVAEGLIDLVLSDGSVEPLDPSSLRVGKGEALYVKVKSGSFDAKFSRHAQAELGEALVFDDEGFICVELGGGKHRIG